MLMLSRRQTSWVLWVSALVPTIAVMVFVPRIAQSVGYHNFADTRRLMGVPNALNVLSNLAFCFAGSYGLLLVLEKKAAGGPPELTGYSLLFAGAFLTTYGSAYYHFAPDSFRLFWDRLPMTLGFMGLTAAILAERLQLRRWKELTAVLVAIGVASVVYWRWSEQQARGDLRPYGLVQFLPALIIPLVLALTSARFSRTGDLLPAAGCYALAKICEAADEKVYALSGYTISGHTIKHLLAGAAVFVVARMLAKRAPLAAARAQNA